MLALTLHGLAHLLVMDNPPCSEINSSQPWEDCVLKVQPLYRDLPRTGINFTTTDAQTYALFSHATECEAANTLKMGPGFEVLVEGGHYNAVWLETQPMGGAMYGLRNLRLAVNNQLIFMRTQREDGRLPGMVTNAKGQTPGSGIVHPTYSYPGNANHSMLQGFYMASPAVDVAWLMNRSDDTIHGDSQASAFLAELKTTLTRFDSWLWATRNSSQGVLWLEDTADTGEDRSDKYKSLPSNPLTPPFENMDMMGYAYDAQRALARIASIEGNMEERNRWSARMAVTASALKRRLWREEHGACFDRERDGQQNYVSTLVHNNIRAMWHGIFSQEMADTFVRRHLMNISEFWTPTPLVSIAASDPRFQNLQGNDWSGPPEGLTFQRAIRALENYGHHAEVVLAGARQKQALMKTGKFPQQIDPFTSVPDEGDCYGPMLLSMLEYTALTTGIAVRAETSTILWSHLTSSSDGVQPNVDSGVKVQSDNADVVFTFTQRLGSAVYQLDAANGTFTGTLNGVQIFTCTGSTRVVTDADGVVISVIGASAKKERVMLQLPTHEVGGALEVVVGPNEEWRVRDGHAVLVRSVPFTLPF